MSWIKSGIENPSGSLAVVAGMKKPNDHAEPTKVALKKEEKSNHFLKHCNHIFIEFKPIPQICYHFLKMCNHGNF